MKLQPAYILETCLYARDLKAAEAFYTRVLGLELFSRHEGRHVFFRCGHGMFLIFNPDQTLQPEGEIPNHGAMGPGHVAFAIPGEEVEQWKDHLKTHQIEIEAEVTWPSGGRSIYFRDPEGNCIELATPQTWPQSNAKNKQG